MKVYIASSFNLKDRVQRVYETLIDAGHEVPDVWWDESREQADLKVMDLPDEEWYDHPRVLRRAQRHWRNIQSCDAFVLVCPKEGTKKFNGANIELGYAFGHGLQCYSVGEYERSAMYIGPTLDPVIQMDSAEELVQVMPEGSPDNPYAHFMEHTGIALEFIKDESGVFWVTGLDGELWKTSKSDGNPWSMPVELFEQEMRLSDDVIVMDRREIEAFRRIE